MELAVDLVLAVAALIALIAGWGRGALVMAASLAGIVVGAWVATLVAPIVVTMLEGHGWTSSLQRSIAAGVVFVLCLVIASSVLGSLALVVRRTIGRVRVVRGLDSLGGAAMGVIAWAVVVWLAGEFLLSTGQLQATQLVNSSKIVSTLDTLAPVPATEALGTLDGALGSAGFPTVFADGAEIIAGAQAPDNSVPGAVDNASGGVVKILSSAPNCNTDAEGSGWVVAGDRIITNAHVVAGSSEIFAQVEGSGALLPARLVVYDPERDLAVLAVPDLGVTPLSLGTDLGASDPAVVAGYPENGPFTTATARVRQVVQATGLDIYGQQNVTREVYSLRGTVLPGNSGGPLFDTAGNVVGVVFARSTTDSDTGYAMTLDEIAPVVSAASGASEAISSGACQTE
ncbi:MarP family serine protease [Subtercola boreus]|uniref:Serine protease n=1 Tax=Subtercola boreus TaxID=120213 RepID=A0A3E0WAU2_9MICO|nr:MarP family serine protease [Subtercola boreus]RFA20325.1 serine protease [Subtercola boreus]RFA20478.1 serine protease [Subtercola boreus]RFA26728.1 serine protease [Subtercola boreus]